MVAILHKAYIRNIVLQVPVTMLSDDLLLHGAKSPPGLLTTIFINTFVKRFNNQMAMSAMGRLFAQSRGDPRVNVLYILYNLDHVAEMGIPTVELYLQGRE